MPHLSYYQHGVHFVVLAWYISTFTKTPPQSRAMYSIRDKAIAKVKAMMASELD